MDMYEVVSRIKKSFARTKLSGGWQRVLLSTWLYRANDLIVLLKPREDDWLCFFFLCLLKSVLGSVQFPVFSPFGLHHINRISASAEICFSLVTLVFCLFCVSAPYEFPKKSPLQLIHSPFLTPRERAGMYFQRQDVQPGRQLASLSGALWTHVLHALCLHRGAA